MSIVQSKYFKGNARHQIANSHRKGETISYLFEHVFTEDLATTDILEIFAIFPYGRVIGFQFETEGMAAEALDIGFMSGVPGSLEDTRTSGDELIDGVAANAGGATSLLDLNALAETGETPVSIGLVTDTAIVAGPAKKLVCLITVLS